ncbi:MmgE/PrpD family protein [Rhodovastum atsumiense]|uniref:MmgE/PrpD family protein n=1 Tax=Rhodovastum atsumiense TaxID=504468 RepID=A0A5M6ITU8_9PROT|nr:MmgE/PrpD family protein [Rhodovastum atsumiense]KAA5611734.1 MmgE/PrpD family protein [Rhodovastum atsumiense]CAH2604314.1 MmgE/PrpD family protein [Rhodovastum atsumiense]
MEITRELSRFSAVISLSSLPPEVVARARLLVLDLVGSIVRARHDADSTPPLFAAARALGLGAGHACVFGDSSRWTPAGAALLNGALGHSLDFDDTHARASLHPGAAVIPAALAAGEMTGATGADVLAAIVAGYEVTCRLALALPVRAHYDRGFHPTATCGVFGAAAAAGRCFGLDGDGIADAFGIALSQSAGSLQFLANGAWTKRFHVGWAAMGGLSAATLATEGFRGAAAALEGRYGFFNAYAPDATPARALEGLGAEFELMRTAVKPYPSCRYGHAGIDAALALRAAHDLLPQEIESATYAISHAGMLQLGEPEARKANPQSVVDAQFSAPFAIACALATGTLGWDSYRLLRDPTIRTLMPKIHSEADPEVEALGPMAGRLTIAARGTTFEHTVAVPRGEPEAFPSAAELRAKFLMLAGEPLGAERASRLADAVLTMDAARDIAAVLRFGVPPLRARLAGE